MDLLVGIIIVILALWVLGLATGIGGSLIHILLIIAVIVIIIKVIQFIV
jgi:hypothetical protein